MHPDKVNRAAVRQLTDLPNIGPAGARDLQLLGISRPQELAGRDPLALYWQLCDLTGERHDPCVLDTLISVVRFADGAEPRPWWHYTAERKALMANWAAQGRPPG
ncbi:helix-hairpin-helix domain-containing protein [Paludibacterium purpuratum]|uniref:Pathogenicity locus Cdd1 protein n=1 Tax=Paludibacterium purpuratum TaxID=1144873 RepID=A0A4R7BC75_9NEIS|nr:helix-hairpin-helix domain-containing protein [Paludibacterium purpuratum]TDR81505.1 pathogenicity locus Cdd1 protein [Paludibacterium purpuratum]